MRTHWNVKVEDNGFYAFNKRSNGSIKHCMCGEELSAREEIIKLKEKLFEDQPTSYNRDITTQMDVSDTYPILRWENQLL